MSTKKLMLIILAIVLIIVIVVVAIVLYNQDPDVEMLPLSTLGPLELPKALHWDKQKRCLYFVDVYQSMVHKYVPETNTHTHAKVGSEPIAFIIPVNNTDDKFIVSYGKDLVIIAWDGKSEKVSMLHLFAHIDKNVYRANEGKVSPTGMLFVGTHSYFLPTGGVQPYGASLYGFNKNGTSKKLLSNVTIANGMAWSEDGSTFYFIDSLAFTVVSYSYDLKTDTLGNPKLIFDFKKENISGLPDGMVIDEEGKLWVTSFGGHRVIRINPETGDLMKTISIDASQVTSAIFAGPNLNDFYVTTGSYNLSEPNKNQYKHSGYVYQALDIFVSGRAGVPFDNGYHRYL